MSRRRRASSSGQVNWSNVWLLVFLFVAVLSLGTVFRLDKRPLLGLDLQGGASVVLAPVGKSNVTNETLDQAIKVIRSRVDAVGVAEPDIQRQGKNIVIQLPGVKDTDRVLALVGQTAQLRFRPVFGQAQPTDAVTPREEDKPEAPVVLPETDSKGNLTQLYQLGPALADGTIVDSATAAAPQVGSTDNKWKVAFTLTGSGAKKFDEIASLCYPKPDPTQCPTGRIAIVLDGVVKSAPNINTNAFNGRGEITGNFTQRESKDLALVLRYGSLPVELETQQRQTVSPSLGKESLRAGLIAGAVGLGLVLLYMILYYRALGVVVLFGLCASGALLYSILTALSVNAGLALSLAGATGVIVSVGVTVDSYIVFFERLKDDVRSGRTVRTSVARSFTRAWRTILVADGTSFIGAAILYFLTVGPVRGFAFTLALSTALDVVVAWAFTRPVVLLLGRSRAFTEMRFIGVARGMGRAGAAEATS
jgi:preprotein translocase subunit SecD